MKKDSIQTRKRKPKGQGKGKSSKTQKPKTPNEKETPSISTSITALPTPSMFSSSNDVSVPTDLSLPTSRSVGNVNNLANNLLNEKQVEIIDCKKMGTTDIKNSVSTSVFEPGLYAGSCDSPVSNNDALLTHETEEDHSNDVSSPADSEHYSPLSQAATNNVNCSVLPRSQTGLNGQVDSVSDSFSYTNSTNGKLLDGGHTLSTMDIVEKESYLSEQHPYVSSQLNGEVDNSADGLAYGGLAAMYVGGSGAMSPMREGQQRRHFPLYHPYSHYSEYRPSFVKSEPAVN